MLALLLGVAPCLIGQADGLALSGTGSTAEWDARRGELEALWLDVLGRWPEPRCELAPQVLEVDSVDGVLRARLRLQVEPGCHMECYLLRPEELAGAAPGVLVLHSTVDYTIRQPAGLEGPADKHIGLHLAQRGFVTISPRCFIWDYRDAESFEGAVDALHERHRDVTGLAKMIFDASRAVDYLVSLPEVDASRIGCIGHSLGGKETLFVAAFDERIAVAVSSEGGVGLGFCNWEAPWYLDPGIREPDFPRENHEVLALVAPRPFLLIGGNATDGTKSQPFIDAAARVYGLYDAQDDIGLFVHDKGHAFPPEAQQAAYDWLERHLGP